MNREFLYFIPGFILGLTLHEFSHALAATRLGDPTARSAGRLTLNPLAHLDLLGSVMLLVVGFGWAKPVPVDLNYFRSPRRDMAIVAFAGPLSNLVLAVLLGAALRATGFLTGDLAETAVRIAVYGVWINIILAVFNMIPVPPLDGSRILRGIIPIEWQAGYSTFERFGPLVLFGLMLLASLTGVSIFGRVITPVARPIANWILGGA
ncbi:site-2 protease family protein [candidate division KSB1 bacterium]|nr:site-2 protease family protein [candidate division KSB1 bacterium]